MKKYIVYNRITGEILRTGGCPATMFHFQRTSPNEAIIEGEANDIKEKVVNGQVVSKSLEEIAIIEKASKPDPKEELISNKMKALLRNMAIAELKKEGKIE